MNDLLFNTKQLLKTFNRWRGVAGFYPLYFVHCLEGYRLPLFEVPDRSEYINRLTGWQKQAPYIVNDIIKAVNGISNEKGRAVLIMLYLAPIDRPDSWERKWRDKDVLQRLNLPSSSYYRIKQKALLEFARLYRDGWLIEYTQKEGKHVSKHQR